MTILLMDIDGVVSPFLSSTLTEDGYKHFSIGWASWSLNSKTHGVWLKQLKNRVRIVWCSSWEEESNKVSEIFLLPDFEYVKFTPRKHELAENHMWKLSDVVRFIGESDELVIWLDDEFQPDAYEWAKYRGEDKTVLLPCNPAVGWTENDFQKILTLLGS